MLRPSRLHMYDSLQLSWSTTPSIAESTYRAAGLVRTKGTILLLPPSEDALKEAFNAPPRKVSRMSAGAVALCKHFERGGASSEHGRPHPYWKLPIGSNENKNEIAWDVLKAMQEDVAWRNVMLLHPGVAVYEVRNRLGYGMRWTLDLEDEHRATAGSKSHEKTDLALGEAHAETQASNVAETRWKIVRTLFRGFLEPVMGVDHELPTNANEK